MRERRKYERIHLIHFLRVFNNHTNQFIGNMVDITPEGIKLLSEEPVDEDQVYQLRMELPLEVELDFVDGLGGQRELIFDARSVWCDVDINPDLYAIGFFLENITSENIQMIKKLIYMYQE